MALFSAIILSIILLGFSITMSAGRFYARAGLLNHEFSVQSRLLVSSCIELALERILHDYSYQGVFGGETIMVGLGSCTIVSVKNDPEDPLTNNRLTTIMAQAKFKGAFTKRKVIASIHNPAYSMINSASSTIEIISQTDQ